MKDNGLLVHKNNRLKASRTPTKSKPRPNQPNQLYFVAQVRHIYVVLRTGEAALLVLTRGHDDYDLSPIASIDHVAKTNH